jgi:catalase
MMCWTYQSGQTDTRHVMSTATSRIDPFDLPKVWNYRDYPLIPFGTLTRTLTLNRLVDSIAGGRAQVSREDSIERSIGHFRKPDVIFGQRIADGVVTRRQPAPARAAQ